MWWWSYPIKEDLLGNERKEVQKDTEIIITIIIIKMILFVPRRIHECNKSGYTVQDSLNEYVK